MVAGREYFRDGEVAFPTPQNDHDSFYRTRYGFNFESNAVTYAKNDHNQSLAFRRMTATRLPSLPGYHQQLRDNQRAAIRDHRGLFDQMRRHYHDVFSHYTSLHQETEEHYLDPHEKKCLREQAWNEMKESCLAYVADTWLKGRVRDKAHVAAKMKPEEYAKPGKKPRVIGDLGVAASLLGFRYAEFLKTAQFEYMIEYAGGFMIFCKSPETQALRTLFQALENPPGRYLFVYFSDDSTLAYRRPDGTVAWHNLDISSCDVSHTPELFELLVYITPPRLRSIARRLVQQCSSPIKLRSVHDPRLRLTLRPKFAKLYSGSTITTAINNLACTLIMACIADHPEINPAAILSGAERAGYIVTGAEPLERFQKVQFLKHSPVWAEDHWHPVLNLGVLLRLSGNCKQDLPGRGPLRPRAFAFQSALLQGAYPYISNPIIDRMKQVAALEVYKYSPREERDLKARLIGVCRAREAVPVQYVSNEELLRRYDLTPAECTEIIEITGVLSYGQSYSSAAFGKVLFEDYALRESPSGHLETNDDNPRWPTPLKTR